MKKILIGAIIGALFLASISLYLVFRPAINTNSINMDSSSSVPSQENKEKVESFSGADSLKSLIGRAGAFECTMSFDIEDGTPTAQEGTFFMKNGELRSDSIIESDGVRVVTSVIIKDGYVYSWSDMPGVTQGVKIKADETEDQYDDSPKINPKELESLDEKIKYECRPWKEVDNSVFELPKNIIFKDVEDLMKAGMEDGTVYVSHCSVCDDLTGDEKSQCLSLMSCE